jgi:hypothetical protein
VAICPRPAPALLVGKMNPGDQLCGRFTIIKPLGRPGAIGEAFEVKDALTELSFVCKVARDFTDDTRTEFKKQYAALLGIPIEAVARAYGFFDHEDGGGFSKPVLQLELVRGSTLDEWSRVPRSLPDRVRAVQRVGAALAALHAVAISHGDVHGRNVLVLADRVVLIDPGGSLFGSVSGEPTKRMRPPEPLDDLKDLAELMRTLVGAETAQLGSLIERLRSGEADAALARDHVDMLLRNEVFGVSSQRLLTEAFQAKRARASDLFRRVRAARALALDRLQISLREAATAWGVRFEKINTGISAVAEAERKTEDEEVGSFYTRNAEVAEGPNRWSFQLDQQVGFGKPFPVEADPGLLQRGTSSVTYRQVNRGGDGIELRYRDGVAFLQTSDGVRFPCERMWIDRNIRLMTGQTRQLRTNVPFAAFACPAPGDLEVRSAVKRSLEISFENLRGSGAFQLRGTDAIDMSQDAGAQFIEPPSTALDGSLKDWLLGVYAVDASIEAPPAPCFELSYLLVLTDGRPASFRFQIELTRNNPVIVTAVL